ncbi:DWNN domain, a CCHC-type zinc finger [Prunus dulcis]|uniref:DWNN domain, a CCHC-type zinc finger n=1 Tax=Prunus dulcis TaxID=3755 RepID=A0A4Y1QTB2_PRUDU|nr:DWNN domain, a CCHC-type zinc finger [Prunus dulcis]
MAVQFKFRSSMNFDSVDIDGRTSIAIRDLKSKIIRHKNLNICQDTDLEFSDATTGQEYTDENIQIPRGSSVIIKRVPAGSVHADVGKPHFNSYQNLHSKDSVNVKSLVSANVETVDFDDFGVDLFPIPRETFFSSDMDADKDTCILDYEPNTDIKRYSEQAVGGGRKLEASGLSDAIPEGHVHSGVEHTVPQTKPNPAEDMNLEKLGSVNPIDTRHADLSSELKCSLCNSIFKEAMMIPCCQHSICQVLLEKARCPKCFSTKCRVDDLLPNVSLRQAIEHFLESQNLITGPDNDCCQYAPDGESGIQAKDVSCGGCTLQRESELPHSPETGMGSNHFFAESAHIPAFKKDAPNHLGAKNFLKRHGSTRIVPDGFAAFDDCQGESKPMHEEAEPTIKKKSHLGFAQQVVTRVSWGRKAQKGNAIFPGVMPGYVPSYWNGAPSPHAQPLEIHMEIIGYMRMRGVTPLRGMGEDCNLLIHSSRIFKVGKREENFQMRIQREKSTSYSEDGSTKGSQRQYRHHNHTDDDMLSIDGQRKSSHLVVGGRDQKQYHRTERSSSEVDDMPSSSCYSEEKHKYHHRSSKKYRERGEPCGSGSSRSHHQSMSKKDDHRKRIEHDFKRHSQKHHSHSGSGIEQSVSSDKKLHKGSSRSSRHSKHSAKSNVDELSHDRWQMASGSDEDGAEAISKLVEGMLKDTETEDIKSGVHICFPSPKTPQAVLPKAREAAMTWIAPVQPKTATQK